MVHDTAAGHLPAPARPADSGLACLLMMARLHGVAADGEQLAHEFGDSSRCFGTADILQAAAQLQLQAKAVQTTPERLLTTALPAVACAGSAPTGAGPAASPHYFIIAKVDGAKVLVHDPAVGRPELLSLDELRARWSGELILFASRVSAGREWGKFDFTWFIPSVVRHRRLLGQVLLVSLALQLFALVTPLFFQVVMDKVLVHRGFTTLDVIAIGLGTVMVFEVALTALRTYVFSHTTSRIDVELGARLFRHLLALPLAYFQARRVGDSVARVRELENIRSFLTGNAITVVLDLLFSVVFIAVMLCYSGWLTMIVLASLPCYLLLSLALTPLLRARLAEKFNRGAENQAFLVETVNGIDTVKSMAVEPQWTRRWDQQLAAYVSASFRTTTIASLAQGGVSLVSKAVTLATLYVGARLVIDGSLSVGQLVVFNMLASQVAQPVMRLAQLWTDFQQTGVSMRRLGDILDTHTESGGARGSLPRLSGRITFDDVQFRYRPDRAPVIENLSIDIAAGEVIGIVGRSGSGKSTLAKLLQRLYVAERGRVLIDGIDLSTIESSSLRRQIGVVLQDNMLFNRSIRENIALADAGAPLDAVIQAAMLAGAHEFITALPEGYDTLVGEHGSTLSGGQRQRLAIARALMGNPRILVLDEATSALDVESERIVHDNMKAICRGRTVIIIAHRLSAVRDAHRIVVMDEGRIVEAGPHAELLQREAGHYARLHRLQRG